MSGWAGGDDPTGAPLLLVTRLDAPAIRPQTVPRERLVERLRSGSGNRLGVVVCPAGFGKTTLLAAWCAVEATSKPVAWLALDDGDNDPVVLWSYVVAALQRVCPEFGRSVLPEMVGSSGVVDVLLPRLINELAGQGEVVIVLDDFHRLTSGPARESVAWFIAHLPKTVQLVLASRTEPALPLATLRAHGELLELRADDLRFTADEADALLNGRLGLGLAPDDVDELVERTEGWPAGLYLASLSLAGVADKRAYVQSFGATSRHVVDFLVDEVLEAHDPAQQTLMLRASVLDRFCGPLCDAVMQQAGAAELLDALSHTNLFLVPLDDRAEWYRFHHLFSQLLRVELEHREPSLAPVLHCRAFEWHRDHGHIDEAIHHALEAGAFAEAAGVIARVWVRYANTSKYATVLSWLRRFPEDVRDADVRLLLIQAWVLSMAARHDEAAQTRAKIDGLDVLNDGPLPDGFSSAEASLTLLRAMFPGGDVGAELANALRAVELEPKGSPWRPLASWAVGFGHYFRGEYDEADPWFEECALLAPQSGQWVVCASSLAFRSQIAGERGHLEDQASFAEQAVVQLQQIGGDDLNGEVQTALGTALAARGRLVEALPLVERGADLMRAWGRPIDQIHTLVRLAPVLRAVGDPERATAALDEARVIIETCPDAGMLSERLALLEHSPNPAPAKLEGGELSERELDVLRLLRGSLSERDIASELYLSHNTVHSHTRSIYRKLGVSSRAEAVEHARRRCLI